MEKKREILVLIPARGNSKSIPRKNVREFSGYPLIAYSIAAAKQSNLVTRTIVSTDNEEIAEVARSFGAEVPFIRPDEFAKDDTLDLPVFVHALNWLKENEGYVPEIVIQLRPTSPIRPVTMVDEAIALLINHPDADSVRGVVASDQNPYKMWHIEETGQLSPILELSDIAEPYNTPRQQLPQTYWQTGHIDAIRPDTVLKKQSMTGDVIYPLLISPEYSIDIDTYLDWERAERYIQDKKIEIVSPGKRQRNFPDRVSLLAMDFDGVFTDNRVWIDKNGHEIVAASRSDGMGIERLKLLTNIQTVVISKETDQVVAARCEKLDISSIQSIENKPKILREYLKEKGIPAEECIYVGNDLNDLDCFQVAGFSVVPADAFPQVKQQADLVLKAKGGFGAIRELAEILIERYPRGG